MNAKQTILKYSPDAANNFARRLLRRVRLEAERRGRIQRQVNRRINVDRITRKGRRPGSVWAVCLAKNEADIIEHSVRHMLGQGVAGIIVVDNQSTDDTRAILDGLAREDSRVHVGTDDELAFYQGMKTSYLAHLAWRSGADWIVPFDADEFWFAATSTIATHLSCFSGDRVWADYHNVYPMPEDQALLPNENRPVQLDQEPGSRNYRICSCQGQCESSSGVSGVVS